MNGKDLFRGLNNVGNDLIENAEYGQFPSDVKNKGETGYQGIRRIRKPVLVAAMVALMVLLMGCAVLLLHLEDLRIGEETYTDNMRYAEDGSKIPATEKVKQFISIVGAEGSKNHLAMQEWMDFKKSYDPEGSLWSTAGGFEKPARYNNYVDVYTQEMLDKIDEICQKYDLKLEGDAAIFQQGVADLFAQVTGIPSVVNENSDMQVEFGGARVAECGNFNAAYQAVLKNQQTSQEYSFNLIYDYRDKAYFSTAYLIIEDAEAVQQWNETLPDGTEVLIASDKGGDAYILCDREDAFVNVTIRNVGWNWDSPGDVFSREDFGLIAKALNFSLKPKPVENMAQLQVQLEELYQAREDPEEDTAEAERRRQLYEENEHHESYGDLICRIRDNESYFVNSCNVAYENFWDTMEYTLLDVTGDGTEELILGRDGYIHEIWTVRDGKTARVTSSHYEGYLCQGNVYEDYVFLDGKPYHFYSRIDTDGYVERLLDVEYDAYRESWMLNEFPGETAPQPISEERAMEIIGTYVRIPLDMKPVSEYTVD